MFISLYFSSYSGNIFLSTLLVTIAHVLTNHPKTEFTLFFPNVTLFVSELINRPAISAGSSPGRKACVLLICDEDGLGGEVQVRRSCRT